MQSLQFFYIFVLRAEIAVKMVNFFLRARNIQEICKRSRAAISVFYNISHET